MAWAAYCAAVWTSSGDQNRLNNEGKIGKSSGRLMKSWPLTCVQLSITARMPTGVATQAQRGKMKMWCRQARRVKPCFAVHKLPALVATFARKQFYLDTVCLSRIHVDVLKFDPHSLRSIYQSVQIRPQRSGLPGMYNIMSQRTSSGHMGALETAPPGHILGFSHTGSLMSGDNCMPLF